LWSTTARSRPEDDPSISSAELAHILAGRSSLALRDASRQAIPWRALLSLPQAWAIYAVHFSSNWGGYVMLTWLPAFLRDRVGVRIDGAGYISVAPYAALCFTLLVSGSLCDRLIARGWQRRSARTLMAVVGMVAPAVGFAALSASGASMWLSTLLVCVIVAMPGFTVPCYAAAILDVCGTRLAPVMFAVSSTIATLPGIAAPWLTGVILGNNPRREHWAAVFMLAAFLYVGGLAVWMSHGGTEPIPVLHSLEVQRPGDTVDEEARIDGVGPGEEGGVARVMQHGEREMEMADVN
jgi:hypothetical protein